MAEEGVEVAPVTADEEELVVEDMETAVDADEDDGEVRVCF